MSTAGITSTDPAVDRSPPTLLSETPLPSRRPLYTFSGSPLRFLIGGESLNYLAWNTEGRSSFVTVDRVLPYSGAERTRLFCTSGIRQVSDIFFGHGGYLQIPRIFCLSQDTLPRICSDNECVPANSPLEHADRKIGPFRGQIRTNKASCGMG